MTHFKDLDHFVMEDFSFQTEQIFDFDLRLLDIVRDTNCKSWFQILKLFTQNLLVNHIQKEQKKGLERN